MTSCKLCDNTMWVCENHRNLPWDGESRRNDACGCGAGAPCPDCFTEAGWRMRFEALDEAGLVICKVRNDNR